MIAAHPIYEDLYSQPNKNGKVQQQKMLVADGVRTLDQMVVQLPNNCDTDSAALERLSQLLTVTTTASEVSADLIALDDGVRTLNPDKEAPMASQEESLGAATNSTTSDNTDPNKSNVFQELDDAFTTLDQELESDAVADGVRTLDPDEDRTQDQDSATKGDKSGLIVSAPTPI